MELLVRRGGKRLGTLVVEHRSLRADGAAVAPLAEAASGGVPLHQDREVAGTKYLGYTTILPLHPLFGLALRDWLAEQGYEAYEVGSLLDRELASLVSWAKQQKRTAGLHDALDRVVHEGTVLERSLLVQTLQRAQAEAS